MRNVINQNQINKVIDELKGWSYSSTRHINDQMFQSEMIKYIDGNVKNYLKRVAEVKKFDAQNEHHFSELSEDEKLLYYQKTEDSYHFLDLNPEDVISEYKTALSFLFEKKIFEKYSKSCFSSVLHHVEKVLPIPQEKYEFGKYYIYKVSSNFELQYEGRKLNNCLVDRELTSFNNFEESQYYIMRDFSHKTVAAIELSSFCRIADFKLKSNKKIDIKKNKDILNCFLKFYVNRNHIFLKILLLMMLLSFSRTIPSVLSVLVGLIVFQYSYNLFKNLKGSYLNFPYIAILIEIIRSRNVDRYKIKY